MVNILSFVETIINFFTTVIFQFVNSLYYYKVILSKKMIVVIILFVIGIGNISFSQGNV